MAQIKVGDLSPRAQYTASSGQTAFSYAFPIFEDADLKVYVGATLKTLTDYTVSGAGDDNGGTVILASGATTGDIITIQRDMPIARTSDYQTNGDLLADTLNDDLDKLVMMAQQNESALTRKLGLQSDDEDATMELPVKATRSTKMMGFDSNGDVVVTSSSMTEIDATVGAAMGSGVLASAYQFTGDGTTVAFTLSGAITYIPNEQSVIVDVDGITQHTDTYTTATNVVTFSVAPPTNSDIQVRFNAYLSSTTAVTHASLVDYSTPGGVSRTVGNKLQESVSVKDFGAVGDGTTDDTVAIQAAVDYMNSISATTQASLVFSAGRYKITQGIDFTNTGGKRREIIGGLGTLPVAEIIIAYNGYGTGATDNYVFKFGEESSSYQTTVSISGFHFSRLADTYNAPIGITGILAQSRISNITFGSWNNTTIQLISPQNCRTENIAMFSGGESFAYKDTTGISVRQTGTTLNVVGGVGNFSAADVGHTISLWGESPNYARRKTIVTAYTSATQVTVDTSYTDAVDLDIHFGSPLVSITATGTTLTSDSACFTAEHIGLGIYVKGAGETISSKGKLLKAKIASLNSSTSVELDTAAGTTITGEEFTVPAVEIYSKAGADSSDNSFINLQIENHRGVGLVINKANQTSFIATKIHGEQSVTSSVYSIANIWMQQCQGYFQGSFDAQYLGEEKLYCVYQTSSFNFENVIVRTANDEKLVRVDDRAPAFEGGIVQLDDITLTGGAASFNILDLIEDTNTPAGFMLSGKVSKNGEDATKVYFGNGVYGTSDGGVAVTENSSEFEIFASGGSGTGLIAADIDAADISWNGTAPTSTVNNKYRWHKLGQMVFFDFRVDYAVAGTSNSQLSITLPSDMPEPYFNSGTGDGEIHIALYGFISTSNNGVPGLSKAYIKRDDTGGHIVRSVLNSGTVSAKLGIIHGFYFTNY